MSKPYVPAGTKTRFYRPPTLASDFTEFLDGDIPNMVMDFTLLPSWYDQFKENYEPTVIRGELYADTSKSRYSNTDNNLNIRCDVASGIKKGDMLIASNNGDVFILDWEVALQSNNAPSRAVRCNFNLTVERFMPEETDDLGYLVQEEGTHTIVDALPANAYFYDGRNASFYSANSNPGISPEVNALITVQLNEQTRNLKVNDEFTWGNDSYIITDISWVGVNRAGTSGTLALQSLQKPGGIK
jgi:hypothetical protein